MFRASAMAFCAQRVASARRVVGSATGREDRGGVWRWSDRARLFTEGRGGVGSVGEGRKEGGRRRMKGRKGGGLT